MAKCEERFNKSKMVHSIMRHVAETTQCDLEELYKTVAWPMYRIFGHAFDALKVMVSDDGDAIFKRLEEDKGAPIEVLTPAVSLKIYRGFACPVCLTSSDAPRPLSSPDWGPNRSLMRSLRMSRGE